MNSGRRAVLIAGAGVMLGRSGLNVAAAGNEEIIDIHAHIISRDTKRYPSHPIGGEASDWSTQRPQTFEQLVQEMDSGGVAKAAVVQASTWYGVDNSYLLDAIAANPRRFTGVCTIDTLAPDAVSVLQGWMRRGATGLRIFTGGKDMEALADPRAFPVWEYATDKGFAIALSTQGHGFPQVRSLLQRYPKVKVILDHAGSAKLDDGPPYAAAQPVFELAQFDNLYLKVTSNTFVAARAGKSTPEAYFGRLVTTFGARRLAFGSNLPSSAGPMTRLVEQARTGLASLRSEDRAMILSGTAKRLYPVLS
jgi:predicted TIM-barrel fold metal-dependent hydrolase